MHCSYTQKLKSKKRNIKSIINYNGQKKMENASNIPQNTTPKTEELVTRTPL